MASRTAVLDRVERLLLVGLTAKVFRERVLAELRTVLPYDGHVWLLTDPLTRVGTSPLAYLHDLRLDRVRVDLAAGAGPVTDVAMRWGLHHMGRFAADYKRRFGELPSQTAARAA